MSRRLPIALELGLLSAAFAAASFGCSSSATPSGVTGGAGGNAGSGGASSGAPSVAGSGGVKGESGGAAGTTSSAGSSGGSSSAGASAGGSTSGAGAGGGSGATASSGAAGVAGSPSTSPLRLEVPCQSPGYVTDELCPGPQDARAEATFGGDSLKTYSLTVHVRGLVEPRLYHDMSGQLISTVTAAPFFGATVTPDASDSVHAAIAVASSKPTAISYLNVFYTVAGDFDHKLMAIDYSATLSYAGGSTIALTYHDGNTIFAANFRKIVVPGVAPAPDPFNGQFVQLDVTSMTEAN